MTQNYKKFGYGLTLSQKNGKNGIVKLVLINDNFYDKEIYHFAVIIESDNVITFERDYKTRSGAEKLYKSLIAN